LSFVPAFRSRLRSLSPVRPGISRRRRLLVLGLPALLVAGVVGGTAALVRSDRTVHLVVDGQQQTVRTFSSTVGGALRAAHVTVGEHDTVAPAVGSTVTSGDTVVVRHGRPVALTLGTTKETLWVTGSTVSQALTQLGLTRQGEYVSASRSRPIGLAGIALSVRLPQLVTLVHDGKVQQVSTEAPTVAALLTQTHLTLRNADTLSVPSTAYPQAGMVVRLTRIHGATAVEDQLIPQTTRHVHDGDLYTGETQVATGGQDGVIRLTYQLRYADGKLVSRRLAARVQTAAMVPEVLDVGTKARPVYTATADGLNFGALADCESGGNPSSRSADGLYYGLYQFAVSTWDSVGGSGLPSDASSLEQTYRAQQLYDRVGRSAWPVCGQYL
jgi:uncharacterized protein YabE (DUF348 family)